MIALLSFFLILLVSPLKSKSRLEAENAALRHQLIVLRRKVRGRVQLIVLARNSPSLRIDSATSPCRGPSSFSSKARALRSQPAFLTSLLSARTYARRSASPFH